MLQNLSNLEEHELILALSKEICQYDGLPLLVDAANPKCLESKPHWSTDLLKECQVNIAAIHTKFEA